VTNAAAVKEKYRGLYQAAMQVATPHLRNMGTLGGNLCLDTRCTYYNQNYEWRKAIDFCMKIDGDDLLGRDGIEALPRGLVDRHGARADLARREGQARIGRRRARSSARKSVPQRRHRLSRAQARRDPEPKSCLPQNDGWKSTYWKLRRRGSFDFPILGVAAAVKMAKDGTVEDARLVLGAVSSHPLVIQVKSLLVGQKAADEIIEK
jgi:4-hydroxybenzoyl-CoA reductase subunit beta